MIKLSFRRSSGLFLALLILGSGALLLWRGHQDLLETRQARNALHAKLEALGSHDAEGDFQERRATPGPRDTAAVGRELAEELLTVTAALREVRSQARDPEPELLERQVRLKNDANLLTADGLRAYIAELQQKGDLTDKEVLYLISGALATLADQNPEACLNFMSKPQPGITRQIIDSVASSALKRWALRSPEKAAAWLDAKLAAEPEFLSSESMIQLSMGISGTDPAVALSLMREHLNPYLMVSTLLGDSEIDPTELRTRKQAVAREYLLSLPPGVPRDEAAHTYYQKFFRSVSEGQFEEARAQLEQDPLGKAELAGLFDTFQSRDLRGDQGKWLDWMAAREPLKDFDGFPSLIVNWSVRDAPAAVAWIQQTPDQEARTIALERYATWAQGLIPQQAEGLAVLLPEGEARTTILQQALERWPAEDEEGKAAFAKKHGLK